LTRGMTISSNYTISHCIGDSTQGGSTPNINTGIVDPNNRRLDRANFAADRRHVFNLTGVASMPKFADSMLNRIGSNWRLSGIFAKRSGSFLTITTGTEVALTGIGSQRANQVKENVFVSDRYAPTGSNGFLSYLDRSAFSVPATGMLGNMGRNNVLGPAFWNFDLALSRTFS